MESRNHYHGILPYAVQTVRHWARRLVQHPAFASSDLEDLEQDLMLDLHRRLPHFKPAKAGLTTFISQVVARCAASLIEKVTTEKRGGGQEIVSLNSKITNSRDAHSVELIEAIPNDQGIWEAQQPHWSDRVSVHLDLDRIIGGLPQPLRLIAGRFLTDTVSEILSSAGLSRFCLKKSLATIQRAFVKAGYREAALYHPRTSCRFTHRFAIQEGMT